MKKNQNKRVVGQFYFFNANEAYPRNVCTDIYGNVITCENNNITIVNLDGRTCKTFGNNGFIDHNMDFNPYIVPLNTDFNQPLGVCLDHNGDIIVADTKNHRIRRIKKNGEVKTIAGDGSAGYVDGTIFLAKFNLPTTVCVDRNGDIIVADAGNNMIRKINSDGCVELVAGDGTAGLKDGSIQESQFNYPRGVCIDGNGNIIIADSNNNRIRKINVQEGTVETIAGSWKGFRDGGLKESQFNYPTGICIDDKGNLIVADCNNHRIRSIGKDVVVTIAGDGNPGNFYGPSFTSKFRYPQGVCVDGNGDIIVADTKNKQINIIRNMNLECKFRKIILHLFSHYSNFKV